VLNAQPRVAQTLWAKGHNRYCALVGAAFVKITISGVSNHLIEKLNVGWLFILKIQHYYITLTALRSENIV
jgi:hypothetical protein